MDSSKKKNPLRLLSTYLIFYESYYYHNIARTDIASFLYVNQSCAKLYRNVNPGDMKIHQQMIVLNQYLKTSLSKFLFCNA
jgi:hypothetical protein